MTIKSKIAAWLIAKRISSAFGLSREERKMQAAWILAVLRYAPKVIGVIGAVWTLYDGGLHGTELAKAALMLLFGLVVKPGVVTGGTVPVTKEAAVRLDKSTVGLPGTVPDALIPGTQGAMGDPGKRGPKGRPGEDA